MSDCLAFHEYLVLIQLSMIRATSCRPAVIISCYECNHECTSFSRPRTVYALHAHSFEF
ncbi:hypothetical protein EDO6_06310 [Paenibacillus xylanexedens]|nr:hypothetical protein EDO6_06310 [Paenibacillus xylanexedens]